MQVREAILKAADSIEANPKLWMFMNAFTPGPQTGPQGCALGWIGHHLGMGEDKFVGRVLPRLEVRTDTQFYTRLEHIHWMAHGEYLMIHLMDATQVAVCMRRYADRYYPIATGIPESVTRLFTTATPVAA